MEFLQGTSPNGNAVIAVAPYVDVDGKPGVAVFVKKESEGLVEGSLDGTPAFVLKLAEGPTGNAPWNFGHELIEAWEKAKKLAAEKAR